MDPSVTTLCTNIFGKLANSADLDASTVQLMIEKLDEKLASTKESLEKLEENVPKLPTEVKPLAEVPDDCHVEALALNCFLTNVVQALERNPGLEHFILTDFLQFCSQNGMSIPPLKVAPEGLSRSLASLNMVADENEETTIVLWDTIRRRMRAGILNNLEKIPVVDTNKLLTPFGRDIIRKRIQFVELLMAIFPASHVLSMYRNLRKNQLKRTFDGSNRKTSVTWADHTERIKTPLLLELNNLSDISVGMLNEDLFILARIKEGPDGVDVTDYISMVYFDFLLHILKKFVLSLESQISSKENEKYSSQLKHNGLVGKVDNTVLSQLTMYLFASGFSVMSEWEKTIENVLEETNYGTYSFRDLENFVKNRGSGEEINTRKDALLKDIVWSEDKDGPREGYNSKPLANSRWPWRDAFLSILPKVALSIPFHLRDGLARYTSTFKDKVAPREFILIKDELYFAGIGCPRRICKEMAFFTSTVEALIPLASLDGGIVFQEVRSIFLESLVACINQYHAHISEVLSGFPESTSLHGLYSSLGSLNFLSSRLPYYEEQTGIYKRKPLKSLIKLLDDLGENIKKIITAYHFNILMSSILHDVYSHNWEDPKPFFEGERISFSLQMWNFHVISIWNDLLEFISPEVATDIMVDILTESLLFLLSRYSHARPSFRRYSQYRADVIFLTTVFTSFIWKLSTSNQDFFFPKWHHTHNLSQWHTLCSLMLAYMVVITGPLSQVTERFLDVGHKPLEQETPASRMWLVQCLPNLFSRSCTKFQDLEDKQAIFIVYKLLVSRPTPQWHLLIQTIMMRHAFLPILLAMHVDKLVEVERTWEMEEEDFCLSRHFAFKKLEKLTPLQNQQFLRKVYMLLNTSATSTAVSHFLMSLANRENNWKLFESSTEPGLVHEDQEPIWLQLLKETVMPTLLRLLEVPLSMLCEKDRVKLKPTFTFTAMTSLPCGCSAAKIDEGSVRQSDGGLLFSCLKTTLELLISHLPIFPQNICIFFGKLSEYLTQRHFGDAANAPGLKTVAYLLYSWITKDANVKSIINLSLSPGTYELIRSFALLLWHTLHNFSVDVSQLPSISMEIHSHLKNNATGILQSLEILKDGLSAVESNQLDDLDRLNDRVVTPQYQAMCLKMIKMPNGKETLHYIYDVLKVNQNIIETKLLGGQTKMPFHTLERAFLEYPESIAYNPLIEYRKCGDYILNTEVLLDQELDWDQWMNFKFDWDPFLVRRVIMDRYEFSDENYNSLTQEEKDAVNTCRSVNISGGVFTDSHSSGLDIAQ